MRVFTNEEATVNLLERAGERVEAVAWGDALAFGRLSASADPQRFAADRAAVYAEAGWDEDGVAEADFALRHAALQAACEEPRELSLLFGASLNDQLQLAQMLFFLSAQSSEVQEQVRLMTLDGPLSIFEGGALLEVVKDAEPLAADTVAAYRWAWQAVTASDPRAVEEALRRLGGGPHVSLSAALRRWLQELPSRENGLSISQMQLLDAARLGLSGPKELMEAAQATEAAPFRIDWEYWQLLEALCAGPDPLLTPRSGKPFLCPPRTLAWTAFLQQQLDLTERGRAILNGERHLREGAFPSRWLGGALIDGDSRWFWDYAQGTIVSEPELVSPPL